MIRSGVLVVFDVHASRSEGGCECCPFWCKGVVCGGEDQCRRQRRGECLVELRGRKCSRRRATSGQYAHPTNRCTSGLTAGRWMLEVRSVRVTSTTGTTSAIARGP